jgi:hypothetical protein
VMLKSLVFSRATAYVGLAAGVLDLAYCIAYPLVPATRAGLLGVLFLPAAGLMLMAWHVLVGVGLLRLARLERVTLARQAPPGALQRL